MTVLTSLNISVRPIRTEADFDSAVNRLYQLAASGITDGSREEAEFEVLQTLVDAFQKVHHPIASANPIEAIKFMMEQKGISESELSAVLGSRSRKSEILSGKRKLSLAMIRKLSTFLGISTDVLVQAY